MIYAFFPSENPRITIQQKSLHIKAQKSIPNCAVRAYCTHPKFRVTNKKSKKLFVIFFPKRSLFWEEKRSQWIKGKQLMHKLWRRARNYPSGFPKTFIRRTQTLLQLDWVLLSMKYNDVSLAGSKIQKYQKMTNILPNVSKKF